MDRLAMRRVLQMRGISRPICLPTHTTFTRIAARSYAAQNVTDISFWKSLIPKPFRREHRALKSSKKSWLAKEWNPATFYIIIFLMIGSMAIQMISLRKNFATYMRRSEVRVGLLREVVEKLQNGEQVDVEKALGTGDAEREAEWEDVINEIEKDKTTRRQRQQQKVKDAGTSVPVAELVTAPEAKPGDEPANEPPKGRVGDFF